MPGTHGKFIQVFTPRDKYESGINADMISPQIDATNYEICFSFYYYIYGELVQNISLSRTYVNNGQNVTKLIWTKRGSGGDRWNKAYVTLPLQPGAKWMVS